MNSAINSTLYPRRGRNFAGALRGLTEKRGLFPRISNYFSRRTRPSINRPPTLDEADPALYDRIQGLRRRGAEEGLRTPMPPPLFDEALSEVPQVPVGIGLPPASDDYTGLPRKARRRGTWARWGQNPGTVVPYSEGGAKRKTLKKKRRVRSSTKKGRGRR
jgi:hypothetical protein